MKVAGYSDRLSVEPSGEITFMVSTKSRAFDVRRVRLIHVDTDSARPGFKADPVASSGDGSHPGRHQVLRPGSYVRILGIDSLVLQGDFTLQTWFWSTTGAKSTRYCRGGVRTPDPPDGLQARTGARAQCEDSACPSRTS